MKEQDFKYVESVVYRYDHLKQNVRKIEFGNYRTSVNNDKITFDHSLSMKLIVDQSQLWSGARSYIWKFLGQYEWTKSDGTLMTINRIHVK